MRIVLLDKEEGLKFSGAEIFTHRIHEHLMAAGHDVSIIRFAKTPQHQEKVYEIPYYLADPRTYIFIPSEKTLSLLNTYLKHIKPDIIYAWAGLTALDFFLPSLCHKLSIPLAAVWHGDLNSPNTSYELLIKTAFLTYVPYCLQLDLLHVFSDTLKQFFVTRGVDPQRILVLPNGVNANYFRPGASVFRKKYSITQGILFLGRITFQKNPEVLFRSFLTMNPPSSTKLVIAGYGDLEEKLRKKYQDPRIIFTGIIEDEKTKLDILRSCDMFVLPSRYEGMSLALLEAMSCGLACVASDAGNNRHVLEGTGIVIPIKRLAKELPQTLMTLSSDAALRTRLGKSARYRIKTHYNQWRIFAKLMRTLEQTARSYQKN